MKKTSLKKIIATFSIVIVALVCSSRTAAQTLKADFQFKNTRNSSVGAASLTDTGVGSNTFQSELVDNITRSVLSFPTNNGLRLSAATGVIPANSYTIVMLFKVNSVSNFVRLVDFKNRTSDNGLYIDNGHLENCTTCDNITAGSYVQVVYTRTSGGTFSGYLNGVLQGQGPDSANDLVIDASATLNFFQDDTVAGGEASSGSVARIRLYDAPMSGAQVAALDREPAGATTFTVTNTNNSGIGSLRQALLDANANTGTDTIAFNIPGGGVKSIAPSTLLPNIDNPLIIDGYSQPGSSPNSLAAGNNAVLLIELNGSNLGAGTDGLLIAQGGGGSTVRGLIVNHFNNAGIKIVGGGGNTVAGNFIGTDSTGTAAAPNGQFGILIHFNSSNNTIGGLAPADRNLISSNGRGLSIDSATGNTIIGNYLGTNAAGTSSLGNVNQGINLVNTANNNIMGGTTAAARNIIAGNGREGIGIFGNGTSSSPSGNLIQGNLIGTDVTGTVAIANGNGGVAITGSATNNTIGGAAAGARNVISGNRQDGVGISNTNGAANNNTVQGNYVGLKVNGTEALGNEFDGVDLSSVSGCNVIGNVVSGNGAGGISLFAGPAANSVPATNNLIAGNLVGTSADGDTAIGNALDGIFVGSSNSNTIGGTTGADRNLVSGNRWGIVISDTGTFNPAGSNSNLMQGNMIGLNISGTSALPNSAGGVRIVGPSLNNFIGGAADGAGNLISGNNGDGVSLEGGSGNGLRGNSIFANAGLGIHLQPGANNNPVVPVLTKVESVDGQTRVSTTLNTGTPNTAFTFEFFSNVACDSSGSGEGQSLIGSSVNSTDAAGLASFTAIFQNDTSIPLDRLVTATAANNANNTSAFSPCQAVSTFTISGHVGDATGANLEGVAINLTGSATTQVTSGPNGNYTIPNVPSGGNYTVTAADPNYSFGPANYQFNNLGANRIANFVGTQSFVSISGSVTDQSNVGVANVTLSLTKNGAAAGTTQTNVAGGYSFGNLAAGASYVVTPAGSFSPSSQSFNNLTTNSVANFKQAPAISTQCNSVSFNRTDFAVGTGPFATVVGDFNGDGISDIAANDTNVSVLLGTGNGNFAAATSFSTGAGPYSIAAGDLNNDGKLDLVTVNVTGNSFSILLGTGTGTFGFVNQTGLSSPRSVVLNDFNNDGKLDIAIANFNANNIAVFLGDGTGGVSGPTTFGAGTNPTSVIAADFNQDGKLDLAVANLNSDNISVLLGDGSGGFGTATNFGVGTRPFFIRVADFNDDGKLDLAAPNIGSDNVSILLGNGAGSFASAVNFPVGAAPTSVLIGDFNGDGELDLATTNNTSNNVSVLLGTGTGSFGSATNFALATGVRPGAVGDFNNDGKTDLAVPNANSNSVSVLLNNGPACNTQSGITITGQVTDFKNAPLANVNVTLSGPITRVAQTDNNGNYSFSNLAPGGNYAVTLQSPYYVFSPSRTDFFNLGSNQTLNQIAAPLAVPAPIPPLTDDFNSPNRDPNKWNLGTITLPVSAVDPLVTTAQINGQLVITPRTQVPGLHYNGYVSANSFDFRNGKLSVELVKAASGGADTIFGVGTDSDNFARFIVHTGGGPSSIISTGRFKAGEVPLDTTTAQLIFQVKLPGQPPVNLTIPYDPVQHRFLRFRQDQPTNSIIFETSPNADYNPVSFQHSVVLQKGVSALTAELSAGTSSPTNAGAAVFDNVSLVTSTFQFSAANYSVSEVDGSVVVTVTRAGDTTSTGSVDYATADGTARQRAKYINAAGTLSFAAGENSKTFKVLIEDNVIADGEQSLNLMLSNPSGGGLNSPGRAVLDILDNDTTLPTGNPLDDPVFFVKQNYFDFLNRGADPAGLTFWTGEITQCNGAQPCERNKRVDVSNAFFYEQEFQQTGAYVVRLYRVAYGNNQPIANPNTDPAYPNEEKKLPQYLTFATDRARVKGGTQQAQTQLELANAFALRPEFLARYPTSLATADQFIDAVLATIQADLGVNLSTQKAELVTLYNTGGRGAVLYRLADDNVATNPINNRALIDAEYNRAFVYTQYAGYLRRNADIFGFQFWLNQVNRGPLRDGNTQHAMVCSFITSQEYQQRFSSVVTHTNGECPQ